MARSATCGCCRASATVSMPGRCRPCANGDSRRGSAAASPWTSSSKLQWNSRSGEVMMDSALVLITLASLGTTGAVLLYAARLIRDERTRSHARVEALAQEIRRAPAAGGGAPDPRAGRPLARNAVSDRAPREPVHTVPPAPAPRSAIRTDSAPRPAPARDALGEAARFPVRHAAAGDEPAAQGTLGGRAMMFESASTESASSRWLVP